MDTIKLYETSITFRGKGKQFWLVMWRLKKHLVELGIEDGTYEKQKREL